MQLHSSAATVASDAAPPRRARRAARAAVAAHDVDIVLGTTALNNESETFARLGLVVVDEQHRFGVRQRALLAKKDPEAPPPHVLHMTATPIPRTIAMTTMAHMAISVIDELPPGRLPVACGPPVCMLSAAAWTRCRPLLRPSRARALPVEG